MSIDGKCRFALFLLEMNDDLILLRGLHGSGILVLYDINKVTPESKKKCQLVPGCKQNFLLNKSCRLARYYEW